MTSPDDPSPRICVLTGLTGSGKTAVANWLRPRLPAGWTVIRGDDFVGVAEAFDRRTPRPGSLPSPATLAGWSAGWYLALGRGVLVEGLFRAPEEIAQLHEAARMLAPPTRTPVVVCLTGKVERFARELAEDPDREPSWKGADRLPRFLQALRSSEIDPAICSLSVDSRAGTIEQVAREVARAFGLPLSGQPTRSGPR